MITIQSIRLRNFRAIREAVFQPLPDGITGIFGTNGGGKTSFLVGTLFALFGETPKGVSTGGLRREKSDNKEECSVSVVFTHMGQTIEVIREIKGANNRVVLDIIVDGIPETKTSVGTGDSWMTKRLGMDAKGFVTTFVIPQKQLDDLVKSTSAPRKELIEKLSGIDTIEDALKNARKDERTAKDILGSLPGTEKAITEAQEAADNLSEVVERLQGERNTHNEVAEALKAEVSALYKTLEKANEQKNRITLLEGYVATLKNTIASATETRDRLSYVKKHTEDIDVLLLREKYQTIAAEVERNNHSLNALRVRKAELANRVSDHNNKLDALRSKLSEYSIADLDSTIINQSLASIDETLINISQTININNHKVKDFSEKILALSGDEHVCPTCDTHLIDPQSIIDSFQLVIETGESENIALETQQERLYKERELLNNQLVTISQHQAIQDDISRVSEGVVVVTEELNAIASEEPYIKKISELTEQQKIVTEDGLKAKHLNDDKQAFTKSLQILQDTIPNLNVVENELAELYLIFSEEEFETNKGLYQTKQQALNTSTTQLQETYSQLTSAESAWAVANSNVKSATAQWDRKKELLVAQERKALTTELIDKFRRESVAAIAPELSDYATQFIPQMSNGAYTEIKLNENFDISVVNAIGEERAVSALSGGEESIVALSLRLAIAYLVTGGNPSFLWMDEVLTAQDVDRRTAVLQTISQLNIDQIIMINHVQEAADIVDKTVTVIPNLELGSTLQSDDGANNEFETLENEEEKQKIFALDDIQDDDDF